ncbi:MAG: chorismate-binding protein, partial [Planctomycetota bacterium]
RYSHVMHISSTVTGTLDHEFDAWDALRAALPVGTISGAPKIRAMQIIDELEPTRRGPYGGGIGAVSFHGDMDIALALRTMVIPTAGTSASDDADARSAVTLASPSTGQHDNVAAACVDRRWQVHVQAGAGVVADSVPAREFEETVHKAAALARAIDLAERAFTS